MSTFLTVETILWETKKFDVDKVNKFIRKIFNNKNDSANNVGIIKVDLYHTNIPIYKDIAMYDKEDLFIYNNIPTKLCNEIKIKI